MKRIRFRPDGNFNRKVALKSQGKRVLGSGVKGDYYLGL
jgi:hypothetical protein